MKKFRHPVTGQVFQFDDDVDGNRARELMDDYYREQAEVAHKLRMDNLRANNNSLAYGAKKSFQQFIPGLRNALGAGAKFLGADEFGRAATDNANAELARIEEERPTLYDSFSENPLGYTGEMIGQQAAPMLSMVAGGWAGAAGKAGALPAGAARAAAMQRGGLMAAAAVGYPQHVGENFGQYAREYGYDAAPAGTALAVAAPQTALDTLSLGRLAKGFGAPVMREMSEKGLGAIADRGMLSNIGRYAAREIPASMAHEGGTEFAQEALKIGGGAWGTGGSPMDELRRPERIDQMLDAAGSGALVGGVFGGLGGARQGVGARGGAQEELARRQAQLSEMPVDAPVAPPMDEAPPATDQFAMRRRVAAVNAQMDMAGRGGLAAAQAQQPAAQADPEEMLNERAMELTAQLETIREFHKGEPEQGTLARVQYDQLLSQLAQTQSELETIWANTVTPYNANANRPTLPPTAQPGQIGELFTDLPVPKQPKPKKMVEDAYVPPEERNYLKPANQRTEPVDSTGALLDDTPEKRDKLMAPLQAAGIAPVQDTRPLALLRLTPYQRAAAQLYDKMSRLQVDVGEPSQRGMFAGELRRLAETPGATPEQAAGLQALREALEPPVDFGKMVAEIAKPKSAKPAEKPATMRPAKEALPVADEAAAEKVWDANAKAAQVFKWADLSKLPEAGNDVAGVDPEADAALRADARQKFAEWVTANPKATPEETRAEMARAVETVMKPLDAEYKASDMQEHRAKMSAAADQFARAVNRKDAKLQRKIISDLSEHTKEWSAMIDDAYVKGEFDQRLAELEGKAPVKKTWRETQKEKREKPKEKKAPKREPKPSSEDKVGALEEDLYDDDTSGILAQKQRQKVPSLPATARAALEKGDLKEALRAAYRDLTGPLAREAWIGQRLVQALNRVGAPDKVRVDASLPHAGQYEWGGGRSELVVRPDANVVTLAHEATHHLTASTIQRYMEKKALSPAETAAMKDLQAAYDAAKAAGLEEKFADQMADLHEFAAEVYTSPTFRSALADVKMPGASRNAFNTFVRAAMRLLGLNPDTAAAKAFDAVERIIALKEEQGKPTDPGGGRQTDTPAFKAWFGDSKVVDDAGKPLVVYHGTPHDITEFNTKDFGALLGKGAYFTANPEDAAQYAGKMTGIVGSRPNIVPAFISIKNPYRVDSVLAKVPSRASLEADGYDGVILEKDGAVRWAVAFFPEQIKSAIGNRGTFDPKDGNILRRTDKAADADPKPLRLTDLDKDGAIAAEIMEKVKAQRVQMNVAIEKTGGVARKFALKTLDFKSLGKRIDAIAERVGFGTPAANAYEAMKRQDAIRQSIEATIERGASEPIRKLKQTDPTAYKKVSDIIFAATTLRYDPSAADSEIPADKRNIHSPKGAEAATDQKELQDRYDALKPNERAAIVSYFKTMRSIRNEMINGVIGFAKNNLEALRTAVNAAETDEEKASAQAKAASGQGAFDRLEQQLRDLRWVNPYAPLMRFGDYMVHYVNANGQPGVMAFTSETARDAGISELKRQQEAAKAKGETGPRFEKFNRYEKPELFLDALDKRGQSLVKALREVGEHVEDTDMPKDVFDRIVERIADELAASTPANKLLESEAARKNYLGFDRDLLRATGKYAVAAGRAISAVREGRNVGRGMYDINRLAAGTVAGQDEPVGVAKGKTYMSDEDLAQMKDLASEVNGRYAFIMSPEYAGWANALTKTGFMWFMGLNPSNAIMNMMQIPMVQLPVLAGRYGVNRASAALTAAVNKVYTGEDSLNDFLKSGRAHELARYDAGALTEGGAIKTGAEADAITKAYSALRTSANPFDQYRAMMVDQMRMGSLEDSATQDLMNEAQGKDPDSKLAKAELIAAGMMRKAEQFNRLVSATGAFELVNTERDADWQSKMRQVAQLVYEGHGDYSPQNAPKLFQSNLGKVLLLFKKFGFHMYTQMWGYAKDALDKQNLSPEERKIAAKKLGTMMFTTAAVAGGAGLPLFGMLSLFYAGMMAAFGDDDETRDLVTKLRQLMDAGGVSKTAREALLQGLPTLLNVNVSSRLGYSDMFFRNPEENMDSTSWYKYAFETIAGPVGAIPASAVRGTAKIMDGQVADGMATMMPAALRNLGNSLLMMDREHVLTKRGDVIADVDLTDALSQLVGFTPAHVALQRSANTSAKAVDERLAGQRRDLLANWRNADARNDTDARDKFKARIDKFNAHMREIDAPKMVITPSTMEKSREQMKTNNQLVRNGVLYNKNLLDVTKRIRDVAEDD